MRNIAPTGVRIPENLKERLQQSAKDNHRSLNSEIITRLEASYDDKVNDKLDKILSLLSNS